jgi:antitoxin component of MazEF toxin-antitoxin module
LQPFADSHELCGVQQLLTIFRKQQLERSFASKPTDVGLKEFFLGISKLQGKSIDDVVENFFQCLEGIELLVTLENGLLIQQEQYLQMKMRRRRFSAGREKLIGELIQSLHNQAAEIFELSSCIFDTCWEYIPSDLQRTLLIWAESHVGEISFCENVDENFKSAVLSMQKSLKSAKEAGITKSPFEVSSYVGQDFPNWKNFPKRKKIEIQAKDVNNSLRSKRKKYTLSDIEEIAKEINPQDAHEATDWGLPVGEEFW